MAFAASCSFFSENEAEGACSGFSRLVTLAICSQLDGGARRLEPQLRKRIAILSGGEASQAAIAFAAGHVNTYKDGLRINDGMWLPQDLPSKGTVFYWNRNTIPWRFTIHVAVIDGRKISHNEWTSRSTWHHSASC
jgi:hypothetical protein